MKTKAQRARKWMEMTRITLTMTRRSRVQTTRVKGHIANPKSTELPPSRSRLKAAEVCCPGLRTSTVNGNTNESANQNGILPNCSRQPVHSRHYIPCAALRIV